MHLPAAVRERHLKLDAVTDPHHWTYKVPGILVLAAALSFAAIGIYDPDNVFWIVQLLGLYLLLRFLLVVVFYPIGQWRIRRLERRPPPTREEALRIPRGLTAPVHHVVILANFREPEEVVARTLERLSEQANARDTITVVMAMEEAEPDSQQKGERLKRRYARCFAHMLVTVHPRGLAGEVPGKGSNQTWAARRAKEYLVDQKGIPLDSLTVTSCDADSLIHPALFRGTGATVCIRCPTLRAPLAGAFPLQQQHLAVAGAHPLAGLSEQHGPGVRACQSARREHAAEHLLAQLSGWRDEVGYWDEMVIAEDWHILLRCLYGTAGRVTLQPVFLPTAGDSVTGDTIWDAFAHLLQAAAASCVGCHRHRLHAPAMEPVA